MVDRDALLRKTVDKLCDSTASLKVDTTSSLSCQRDSGRV